jgi:lipid-A-disaccharide synthase
LREVVSQSSGGQFLADTTNCSAIGISSAIKIYFRCRRLAKLLLEFVDREGIDLAILCDWGGFNGRLLPKLHALGIPTLYYFPPRSWQRNGSRGLGIVSWVTRVATPFQWSADRLRRAGARAEWVGHPSLENVPPARERPILRSSFGVKPGDTLVALLPGSRRSEIRILAPRMAKVDTIVNTQRRVQFIAVVPKHLTAEARLHLPPHIRIVTNCAMELLYAADAAIVKTGTSTLEAALANTPQLSVYDVSLVGRIEWIGPDCQPEKIARDLMRLLTDERIRTKMKADYALIRQALGSNSPMTPTERTAEIVEEMLGKTPTRKRAETVAA